MCIYQYANYSHPVSGGERRKELIKSSRLRVKRVPEKNTHTRILCTHSVTQSNNLREPMKNAFYELISHVLSLSLSA